MITTRCYKELFKYDITAGGGESTKNVRKCEEGGFENPPKKCDIIFEQPYSCFGKDKSNTKLNL